MQNLFTVCPDLRPATNAELDELEAQGFYSSEFANEWQLPMDLVRLRAGFYALPFVEDDADDIFDAWVEYTDFYGVPFETFEQIDMSLCFA